MRRLSQRTAAIVFLVLSTMALAGLGSEDRPENDPVPDAPYVIALVMKSLANEFFQTMGQGAWDHWMENRQAYTLVANGIKDETDVSQQIRLVEQMIAMGVDALVIAPADSKALIPVCQRAADRGVIIINIDNRFDSETLAVKGLSVPYVGPDNRKGAEKVGRYLAGYLLVGEKVAVIEGVPTAINAQQRTAGFLEAMNANGMNVVSIQNGSWEIDKANRVASALISEHRDLRALLCGNDSMALGAAAAVKAASRQDDIYVVGFDNISAVNSMLSEGRILATADQHAEVQAVYGIELALDILNGQAESANRETPVDLVTR